MSTPTEIAQIAIEGALNQIKEAKLSEDAFARALLNASIAIFMQNRSAQDVSDELEFIAENLDDDQEYTFMRP
jgi:hypothetical protein